MTGALEQRLADLVPAERLGRWTDGTRDLPRVSPDSEEAWRACLRLAHAEGYRVHPVGGETKPWCPLPEGTQLVLSTDAWRGVVAYEPADGTLTAKSGSTLQSLHDTVAEGGHRLSPDVPLPERATLGGVIGAGQSGFDRLRHGGIRDALLGTRVLLADGRPSKSGGRLVKNVTGYDLHRLWCGSRGSLCVVLEASLRLRPAPSAERSFVLDVERAERGFIAALQLRKEAVELRPTAVCVHDAHGPPGGPAAFVVTLQGRSEVVATEEARLRELFPGMRVAGEGDLSESALRDRAASRPSLELHAPPRYLPRAASYARGVTAPCALTAHPLVGAAVLSFDDGTDLDVQRERVLAHLAEIAVDPDEPFPSQNVRVLVRGPGSPPPSPLPSPARALMERLKQGYDPTGVFAGGVPA